MNLSAVINLQLVMFALFICGFTLQEKESSTVSGEKACLTCSSTCSFRQILSAPF